MSVVGDLLGVVRRVVRLDEDVQSLKDRAGRSEDVTADLDRRLVRLETFVQLASGSTLPPLAPRLPRD